MSVRVRVDLGGGVPPYEQIRAQLASLIAAGALAPGTRLPTVRDLAADLGVAVGTVTRAYRELEAVGAVHSRRRTGTVVAEGAGRGDDGLHDDIRRVVVRARALGLSDEELLGLVRGALISGAQ
ncbi:GntR family transcriptional regulator [Georgenia sp. M64]|uniref:GntR family transcriptional regulator n=1 Tax=Georgenia sp. M64 TaxID=3120520 RepID=UPI0030E0A2A7